MARAPSSIMAKRSIALLAGGVGAAKFLRGLVRIAEPHRITIIVNTGDDEQFYGLHVAPDLDTITYTLAGVVNRKNGWGRAGESFGALPHQSPHPADEQRAGAYARQAQRTPGAALSGIFRAAPRARQRRGDRAARHRTGATGAR